MVTSAKKENLGGPPCTVTDSTLIAVAPPGQTVHWDAARSISTVCGNGTTFALGPTGNTSSLTLTSNIPIGGSQNGDVFLAPGNYQIAIHLGVMGEGTYTITFNRQLAASINPASFSFGNVLANASSSPHTFAVMNSGDSGDFDLHVDSIAISGPDAGNFQVVSDSATGQTFGHGLSRNFTVRCNGNNSTAATKTATLTANVSGGGKTGTATASVSCNVQPLVPQISCAPTTNLGSADQTVPGSTAAGAVIITNSGTAPLVINSITMTTGAAAGVFTGPAPGTGATVPPGGTLNENMVFHASVAGMEGTFTGQLTVINNTATNPKICTFSARAHHPVPILALSPPTLDFHDVELGFSFTQAIVATNNGDAPLVVAVHDPGPLPADAAQWSARDVSQQTVAPGAHFSFKQVCTPTAVGNYAMTMGVTSNDVTHPTATVPMFCKGTAPIPIDSVLVLDRSGSMADQIGGVGLHKIDALRTAASLFVDLLNIRAGSSPPPGGDKVAIVKYNDSNSVYVPLGAPFDPTTDPRLQDGAQSDSSRLLPTGATGIGGAMKTGAGLISGSPPDRKHVMVVLTDGIENQTPHIADVMSGPGSIPANDPALKIYSLGLGPDNEINAPALQSITNQTNGFHQVANQLDDIHMFDLEAFFFKIFTASTDWQMVVDPTFVADLTSPTPIVLATAHVNTSDHSAVFLALDNPATRAYYTLELVDPLGNVIVPGSTVGGVPVHTQTHNDYRIVRVIFPDISKSSSYIGDWILRLTPKAGRGPSVSTHGAGVPSVNGIAGKVPIGFAAAVASDFKLAVTATAPSYVPGADVTLTATMTDRGWPAPNGSVVVDIDAPAGSAHYANVALYDDGTHGDVTAGDAVWTGHFINTAMSGSYKFFFKAAGHNEHGELAPRQDTRYVELIAPPPPGQDGSGGCLSCRLQWLLWGLVITLLLLSLLCCLLKGRLPWLR